MRKMISEEERKVLKNFAVNDNGTIVEIGGNVAFESIEQIGHMVESDIPTSGHLDFASQTPPITQDGTVATNVESVVITTGTAQECPVDLPFLVKNGVVVNGDSIYWYVGDKAYCVSSDYGCELDIVGELVVNSATSSHWSNLAYDSLVFKPFFTEEQYQEILDLIA